jgi:hypothetical protein
VHSKSRNRLQLKRTKNLVYVYTNLRLMVGAKLLCECGAGILRAGNRN